MSRMRSESLNFSKYFLPIKASKRYAFDHRRERDFQCNIFPYENILKLRRMFLMPKLFEHSDLLDCNKIIEHLYKLNINVIVYM